MPFFTDVDDSVQQTIESVTALEEKSARKLLTRFQSIRKDLRDRLDVMIVLGQDETFTGQQQAAVLVQVDAAIAAINGSLKIGMGDAAEESAFRGARDLIREVRLFSKQFEGVATPLNIDAAVVALDTKNFLINQYETSINSYSEDLRAQITRNLGELSLQKLPFDTMIKKMSKFFIGEEWKLRRVARTELHNVYNKGKLNAMTRTKEEFIPDLMKALIHALDTRTGDDSKLLRKLDLKVPIDKPFIFNFRGKKRVFMSPPDRPNDRSILVPYRKEWDQ